MNRRLTTAARRTLRKGFTLLEILIAVAIVGMLVGIAVTNIDKILGQSQEGVAKLFVNDPSRPRSCVTASTSAIIPPPKMA